MHFYTIKEAIRGGTKVRIRLRGRERVVEPHLLGRNRRGDTLVRAYQVGGRGQAEGWKLLRLEEIEQAVETGERFSNPRPGYRPRDRAMAGGIIESF
jgi:predicted DNA-binding transcriptional regulator YafY